MFCLSCFLKFVNPPTYHIDNEGPVAACPKCNSPIWDTYRSLREEEKAEKTYTVDAAGVIYCVENDEPLETPKLKLFTEEKKALSRAEWEAMKARDEAKEDKFLDEYMKQADQQKKTTLLNIPLKKI